MDLLYFFQKSMDDGLLPHNKEVQSKFKDLLLKSPISLDSLIVQQVTTAHLLSKDNDLIKSILPKGMPEYIMNTVQTYKKNGRTEDSE